MYIMFNEFGATLSLPPPAHIFPDVCAIFFYRFSMPHTNYSIWMQWRSFSYMVCGVINSSINCGSSQMVFVPLQASFNRCYGLNFIDATDKKRHTKEMPLKSSATMVTFSLVDCNSFFSEEFNRMRYICAHTPTNTKVSSVTSISLLFDWNLHGIVATKLQRPHFWHIILLSNEIHQTY